MSGTFGRPSGKRSPVHSDVIATRCSFENMPSCASALPAATLSATDEARSLQVVHLPPPSLMRGKVSTAPRPASPRRPRSDSLSRDGPAADAAPRVDRPRPRRARGPRPGRAPPRRAHAAQQRRRRGDGASAMVGLVGLALGLPAHVPGRARPVRGPRADLDAGRDVRHAGPLASPPAPPALPPPGQAPRDGSGS